MAGNGPERLPRRSDACMVPRAVSGDGLFEVDGTWGEVQPIELAEGVRTIGELELIEYLELGRRPVDTRAGHFFAEATIPSAVNMPHGEILELAAELGRDEPVAFFCNGPQCAATPDAIHKLLAAGRPPEAILYYRGGMHDWMTLGYPTAPGESVPHA